MWLDLPLSFTYIGLYGKLKTILLLTPRESLDESIIKARIAIRTERKWSAQQAVSQTESNLKHQDIVGTTNSKREGLGVRQTL